MAELVKVEQLADPIERADKDRRIGRTDRDERVSRTAGDEKVDRVNQVGRVEIKIAGVVEATKKDQTFKFGLRKS